ncbi:saccharopine dehydrogenase NADP-binding domain-containing protein [Actinoallomurus soli]|uniref:saccharopine dehydrogenase NADP-binding domain-containing protein n=1 Tax=Actinoallomurus soli TaxID=2952535 RepID=UPI0020932D15|nr:saccharopine dehydrogenase NADP-binding domain-containing protein [Actinoallomurus soli]MCO5968187.1 saccharopine dehydrogenase NADP-binding domain-containing protein [Actinoallomurus soli]
MEGRIVIFGATGYTGALTARALVDQGVRPVLAGRNANALAALAAELGGLETAYADADYPWTVRSLVERDDVLVSTVGPFLRHGHAALAAAVDAGAYYLDTAGEPRFVREVFDEYGAKASSALLPAFGYHHVPGNLACALALDRVGEDAARVDVGYFLGGGSLVRGLSAGTLASAPGLLATRMYTYQDGVVDEPRCRVRDFEMAGRSRAGMSIGGSEHFTLPASHPGLREVNVYLGWFGAASRIAARLPRGRAAAATIGFCGRGLARLARRRAGKGTLTSRIVAAAYDAQGGLLTEVHLSGGDPYDFTAGIVAWGARQAASGMTETGALGPVAAFGLSELEAGCAMAGISRVTG